MNFIRVDNKDSETASAFLSLGRAYLLDFDDLTTNFDIEKFLGSMLMRLEEPERWLFLTEECGKYIGFISAKVDRDERIGWGFVNELYVAPDRRRRGWGGKLYNKIAGIFQEQDVKKVWLTSDTKAERFWQSLGFQETGEMENNQKIMVTSI